MTVGLFHPAFWAIHGHWGYQHQTPASRGIWNGVSFSINDLRLTEADYLVVHDDIDQALRFRAAAGGFVLIIGEEKSIRNYKQEFLNQFDLVITSRDDITHAHVIRSHYFHPWRVKKTFDELNSMSSPVKTKGLSSIISNLTILPSHRERFAFMNKLKGHYKEELDWFCKGEKTFLPDKWDGLAPYGYSIAIENSRHENYFTEKISDCFLAYAMPVYSGCPNIRNFFDDRSFIEVETDDFQAAISKIDDARKEELHRSNSKYVVEARRLVLEKYHLIAALSQVLQDQRIGSLKATRTLRPQIYFNDAEPLRFLKHTIKKLIGK